MSKLGFIKKHYKASLLFVASCIVLFSLGFNMIIPFFDKRFNQDKVVPEQKELEPLGVTYGTMPAAVTDSYEWNGISGISPDMIRLGTSQYYLQVYTGPGTDGWANTTRVWNDNGTIKKSIIDSLEFDTSNGEYPNVCNVYDDIYAVSYSASSNVFKIRTFLADDADGQIGAYIDTVTLGTYAGFFNDIIKVSGNMFAIAFSNSTSIGSWLKTVYIDNSGNIAAAANDTERINATRTKHVILESVDSNTIAVAYDGGATNNDGYIQTYNISATTGDITSVADTWDFDTAYVTYPYLKLISGNIYAIAYRDVNADLQIKTFSIAATGAITKSWIDTLDIDTGTNLFPVLFTINTGSVYGVTYQDSSGDGWIKTFNMTSAGIIGAAMIDSLEFDAADNIYWAPIQWVNKSWYYIAYTSTGNDGWSCTVSIDTNWASPTFSNPSPANNSVGQALTPQCAITVNDLNGDAMTVNFYENSTGSYVLRQTNSSVANGTYRWNFAQASSYSLKYYWKVYINDGIHNVSNWYCFTTEAPPSQEKTWQPLYNSTLTFGNITTGNASLFTSTLSFGNTTTTYKPLFTSTLTFGNTTTGHDSLFTSTLSFGNISATTSLFTSTLTFGNTSLNESLFTSLLTFGNITAKYTSLFTSTLTFGNISSGNFTSLFTSNLSFGNISSNHSFFTSLLSFGNVTSPHSLFTSLLTFGNTSILTPATPYNLNLLVINPNPGNGTHNTNYLKSNASGLTTSIDIYYENFTTPPALIPGSYSMVINSTLFTNTPTTWNTSAVYALVWNNATGGIAPSAPLYVGQLNAAGDYTTFRSFLQFDTSILPDSAIITSAYIKLVVWQDFSTSDFNVTLLSVKPPKPHNPLIPSDYSRSGIGSVALGHTNTTGYINDDIFNIVLNAAGINYIYTETPVNFSVRSHKDWNQSAPSVGGNEWITFYGNGMPVANYPKLILNFTIPNSNWQNIVNVTWLSNSSGAWVQYDRTYVSHNCTVTVPAVNFSGVDSYFWHLEWESNHTNNGSSQIFTFTTVAAGGGGSSMNTRDRFTLGLVIGSMVFMMLGFVLFRKKKRKI